MIVLVTRWLSYPHHVILKHILGLWLVSLVAIVACGWMLRNQRHPLLPAGANEERITRAPLIGLTSLLLPCWRSSCASLYW